MPTLHDQPTNSQVEATSIPSMLLQVVKDGHGWVVGTFDDDQKFEKLLPHGEVNPYTSENAAQEAARIWVTLRPEFSYQD